MCNTVNVSSLSENNRIYCSLCGKVIVDYDMFDKVKEVLEDVKLWKN